MADGSFNFAPETDDLSIMGSSQIDLERLYSKHQVFSCLANEYRDAGFEEALIEVGILASFGIDLLVQMCLHKRASVPVLVGLLKKHFKHETNPAQACADMILKAAAEDVIDWEDLSGTAVVKYEVSADVQERLDRFQYPLPMIQEPESVNNNRQTGYCTIRGSIILRNNHHEDDVCLDHINRMNSTPLALNANVVAFVQNQWKNLDKPKDGESHDDFKRRKKAFEKYDRTSRDVLAALMAQGDRFWLTHKYDKRGRTYSQGYHVNYQGNDWNKACIEFADKEPLNE